MYFHKTPTPVALLQTVLRGKKRVGKLSACTLLGGKPELFATMTVTGCFSPSVDSPRSVLCLLASLSRMAFGSGC